MKFMKRESSLALVLLLVALMTLPSLLSSNAKKVAASTAAQDTSRFDGPAPKAKTPRTKPQLPSGNGPANDNCANAITVTCPTFTDTRSTSGATDEVGEPQSTCTLQENSVWYTLTTGSNFSTVDVSTCNSVGFDTAVMVWKVNGAACDFANFAPIACNDDSCGDGFQSQLGFTAEPNSTYKIQVGGFDGETGNLTVDIDCTELACPPIVINGTLGSGDPNFEGTQASGNQLGRLNRNGIASSCAAPKTCLIFTAADNRAFDSYSIPNLSGEDACVSINLDVTTQTGANYQSNAYLNTYDPNNICTGYLGDPGLSSGVPPTPTNFSVVVPAGQTLIVVVHTTNPGETGGNYTLTLVGDLCAGFDVCVQQDSPRRFLQFSTTTGNYRYTDCAKNIVREGTGTASMFFCKTDFSGSGPGSSATALVNPCTKRGDATIRLAPTSPFAPPQTVRIIDTNITNNDCACPE
jgi:hypothetical protein